MTVFAKIHCLRPFFCCVGLTVLVSLSSLAADLAVLRNGFTIRHERRETLGENTRLFTGTDSGSYVDVPTSEIQGFEKDLTLPPASVAPAKPSIDANVNLNQLVNSASAAYHLDPDLVNSVILAESGFNTHAVSRKGAQGLM